MFKMSAVNVDTHDASTHRWRGSQLTGPVRTTWRIDARTARQRPRNK